MLPRWLRDRITEMTAAYLPSSQLVQAYDNLSRRYRLSPNKRGFQSPLEAVAYVGARLPATFACVQRCLEELPDGYLPATILDVGCGPGTATLASLGRFAASQCYLFEENPDMVKIGQHLFPSGNWHQENILVSPSLPQSDLVFFSYVLNEIPVAHHSPMLDKLWRATNDYLLIITAGTPDGFAQLRQARHYLIDKGAAIIAPCPHALSCPLQGKDWCHFSVRLNRSELHRSLKDADLNYEDEKFSYLLVSKHPQEDSYHRVIKHPQHRSGHGTIDFCTHLGELERFSYSKSKSKNFQKLRQISWGDRYEPS